MPEMLADDVEREITRIRADVAEARRYQEAYSGVTQSQISCILPALDRLTNLVEYLFVLLDTLAPRGES